MARRRSRGSGKQKNVAGALVGLVAQTILQGVSRRAGKNKSTAVDYFGQQENNTVFSVKFLLLALFFFTLAWIGDAGLRSLVAVVIACLSIVWWSKEKSNWQKICSVELADVDNMTGHDFEQYVGKLMARLGYRTEVTKGSGDNGVDIIAERDGIRWAVQCKRQQSNVARDAVSDAVAATLSTLFNCSRAMVVTNGYFSRAAEQYGKSTNCMLVDRNILASWIVAIKKTPTVAP